MAEILTIYTDGASRGNPGKGGWGVIIFHDEKVFELAGRSDRATNNQMELMAVIEALRAAKKISSESELMLHSDSTYVIQGTTAWLDGWVRNNWITSTKKPVENRELWEEVRMLRDSFRGRLHFVKVEGHSGELYNDRCDELAVRAALEKPLSPFNGTREAYAQLLRTHPPQSEKKSSKKETGKKAYSYISLVDGVVHRDQTWEACEKRVKGKQGAKFKKVFSKEEETSLIQDYTISTLL